MRSGGRRAAPPSRRDDTDFLIGRLEADAALREAAE
jgi:hypothetical protein